MDKKIESDLQSSRRTGITLLSCKMQNRHGILCISLARGKNSCDNNNAPQLAAPLSQPRSIFIYGLIPTL
jgi:hypothetical protein